MGALINSISFIGWSGLLSLTLYKFSQNPTLYFNEDITLEVGLLTLVQTFQIFDIILILIGKSKGSLLGSIAQVTGRLVVTWIFIEDQTYPPSFAMLVVMWSIADMIRYSYYLNKNQLTAGLRYHAFLVLYPVGVYYQMRVINDYIRRHASPLTVEQISMIRMVQAGIILGMIFLYLYMIRASKKYYAKQSAGVKVEQTEKVPEKKTQ